MDRMELINLLPLRKLLLHLLIQDKIDGGFKRASVRCGETPVEASESIHLPEMSYSGPG